MNYDELLAPAAKFMRPSGIRKFFDLAAEMPHCISLGVGEPDFKTPWTIRDAGIRSLEQGRTRYTANAGIKELRAEICRYLARRMELNYQPSEVLVTVGGSEAIDLTIRALVKPGDEVIIPEPCFVCYEPITSLTGGVPVHIATKVEDDFRLRADQLRKEQQLLLDYARMAVTEENVGLLAKQALAARSAVAASTLAEEYPRDFARIIGLHTYSQSPRRAYDITLTGNWVERGGFRFEEFILTPRREDADHGRTE